MVGGGTCFTVYTICYASTVIMHCQEAFALVEKLETTSITPTFP